MNNNVHSVMQSSRTSKESLDKQRVVPDSKYSFAGFLMLLQQENKAISARYSRIESEEAELRKTYSTTVADEKTAKLKSEHNGKVKAAKDKLSARLDSIIDGKRSAIEKFVTMIPSDEILKLIQTVQVRVAAGGKIGDNEWNMIVRRVSDEGNYMALNMLNDIAITIGKDFKLPFDVDFYLSELDDAQKILKSLVDKIETPQKDWSYQQMVFLSDKPNEIKDRYIAFDSILGVSVPEKEVSTIDKLREAAQVALHNEKDDLFREIYQFISDNRDQLQTEEEARFEVMEKADELISKGLATGEEK